MEAVYKQVTENELKPTQGTEFLEKLDIQMSQQQNLRVDNDSRSKYHWRNAT